MSNYIYNLGASIERALASVPRAQPAQVAGYWANRDFWLAEFEHLLTVIEGFDERLKYMLAAYYRYTEQHGGEHNRDEYGTPFQRPQDHSSSTWRREEASEARAALKAMADRALSLGIATYDEYDAFLDRLKVTRP